MVDAPHDASVESGTPRQTVRMLQANPFQNRELNREVKPAGRSPLTGHILEALNLVVVWKGWLALALLVGLGLGILYLNVTPHTYRANMVFGPETNDTNSLLQAMSGSPLAALARGPLGMGGQTTPFTAFRQALISPEVGQALLNDPEIAGEIFNAGWSPTERKWHQSQGLSTTVINGLRGALGRDPWAPPSAETMMTYIAQNVTVSEIEETQLYTMSYASGSPEFAKKFLYALYRATDGTIKHRDLDKANAYISYLENQIQTVTNTEQRMGLITLLSEQEKNLMMTSVNVPYAAKIISEPSVQTSPVSPSIMTGLLQIPLVVVLLTFAGLYVFRIYLPRMRRGGT
ncbi:MAG: hypothetical protein WDN01_01150 [Rhizomicrobium sp.]